MEAYGKFSKSELMEFLHKGWMTHDAMWFLHCAQEVGIEKTNKINRAAVRAMAAIEVNRVAKLLGMKEVSTFEHIKRMVMEGFGVLKPKFMKFQYTFPRENVLRWDTDECFAYEGIKKMGVIDQYDCGILDRAYGWMDGLGIPFTVEPEVTGCMMHTHGVCWREIKMELKR